MQRFDPSNIIVKYSRGRFCGRVYTSLIFRNEYAAALRTALATVKAGCTNVEVIQYRETLHTHQELADALKHLTNDSTDEEIIEEVHNSSRRGAQQVSRSQQSKPLVWAQF